MKITTMMLGPHTQLWFSGEAIVGFKRDHIGFCKRWEDLDIPGAAVVENFDYRLDGVLTLAQLD